MKQLFLFLFILITLPSFAQEAVGIFPYSEDIGKPERKGSAIFHEETQSYTLNGSGYNIWFDHDQFHYTWKKLSGDFILTASFKLTGNDGDPHRKTGWMIRQSTDAKAAHISGVLHGDGLTVLQWRNQKGDSMRNQANERVFPKRNVQIIQLERKGDTFIMRVARFGEPLQVVGSHEMKNLGGNVLAGLFICSHDSNVMAEANVWNVRIDHPAPEGYDPGKEGRIGSRLETMNVFNGKRKVIYEKDGRFEAPNWMPDGKNLLFNMGGFLYTIPVAGGEIKKWNTGSASRINNDHCISFDGKLLGISNDNGKGSNVFVLPLEGGEPRAVTHQAPSYLHGWAPGNKEVVYVAQRNGIPIYNIYKKSINGGEEIKLTDNQEYEHADGCEYSPDGKFIYYNASQKGGTMQIWRMKPDGSDKEQLTFDAWNNWFPHISPDGKWIAFISFPPNIELNAHPSYKRVMLRLMPADGGAPRVIAYLYGGQGTINVNSWSPDSRYIGFVSNN